MAIYDYYMAQWIVKYLNISENIRGWVNVLFWHICDDQKMDPVSDQRSLELYGL
jgi:hypothetical protein